MFLHPYHRTIRALLYSGFVLVSASSCTFAQVNWDNGGGDGLWTTGTNWDTNTVLTATNAVVNATNFSVVLNNGIQTITSLLSSGTGNFTISGGATLAANTPGVGTLSVNGTFTMNSGTLSGFVVSAPTTINFGNSDNFLTALPSTAI